MLALVALQQDDHRAVGEQQRKEVGRIAHQRETHVRQPGPRGAAQVADFAATAGGRPARVAGTVGDQGQQQVQAHGTDAYKRALAQAGPKEVVSLARLRHGGAGPRHRRWERRHRAPLREL